MNIVLLFSVFVFSFFVLSCIRRRFIKSRAIECGFKQNAAACCPLQGNTLKQASLFPHSFYRIISGSKHSLYESGIVKMVSDHDETGYVISGIRMALWLWTNVEIDRHESHLQMRILYGVLCRACQSDRNLGHIQGILWVALRHFHDLAFFPMPAERYSKFRVKCFPFSNWERPWPGSCLGSMWSRGTRLHVYAFQGEENGLCH